MKLDRDKKHFPVALDQLRLPMFADRDFSRPFVVALEGANGAGKTTLCHLLARSLKTHACFGTDDAWLSDVFKTRMIRDAEWFVSAMFFLSGCFEQMRVLRDRPEPLVIMDRSLWSTLAIHSAESTKRLETLLAILQPVADQITIPDLTLVLEADFETCQSRIARKSGAARRLDALTATPAFHAREQAFYRWLAHQHSEVLFLDANQAGPEAIAEQATMLIREKIGVQNLAPRHGRKDETSAGAAS
jgi:thymidylate kinase